MRLKARMDPREQLVRTLGGEMMDLIRQQGQAIVQEVIFEAHRRGVDVSHLPYVFWAMTNQESLPSAVARQKMFGLMIDIMTRTGAASKFLRKFQVIDDAALDDAVDAIALHMAGWASRHLVVKLAVGYHQIRSKLEKHVPAEVPSNLRTEWLNQAFREILWMHSTWFEDSELMRRVMRQIPE